MRDLYIGNLLEGETYETFDGRIIYIDKVQPHYVVTFECLRAERDSEWSWHLRTPGYLRRNFRTILDMED